MNKQSKTFFYLYGITIIFILVNMLYGYFTTEVLRKASIILKVLLLLNDITFVFIHTNLAIKFYDFF